MDALIPVLTLSVSSVDHPACNILKKPLIWGTIMADVLTRNVSSEPRDIFNSMWLTENGAPSTQKVGAIHLKHACLVLT